MTEAASAHWSQQKEKTAGYWNVKILLILFKLFPVVILRAFAYPVGFFYFLFSKTGRAESKRFLKKIAPYIDDPKTAGKCRSCFGPLRHIVSFSLNLAEKIQTWGGKYSFNGIHFQDDAIRELIEELESGKGVFLITSHLGNIELLRGLVNFNRTGVSRKIPITAIIDVKISGNFTRMLKELNPQSILDIISAKEIGPDTAVLLEEKLAAGEMVTIAGDRTSAGNSKKDLMIPFLGEEAPFSPGIFYLAAMMNVPVYFIFALRRKDISIKPEYDMHVHKSTVSFSCSRKERLAQCSQAAHSFAALLESYCKKKPFQWYNFFDFWAKGE